MQYLRTSLLPVLILLGALLPGGCRTQDAAEDRDDASLADAQTDGAYPLPRTDLVSPVGSDETFELATWNIENYPKNSSTPATVADLISSLDLDMVALQEVENVDAFNELVARLPGYEGLLSSHTYGNGNYQKVGYVFKSDLVELSGGALLFTQEGYDFPRPAFKVEVSVDNGSTSLAFTAIALHLKAGGSYQDRLRRENAVVILEEYLRSAVDGISNPDIAVLGDFNERLNSGSEVFVPISGSTDRYRIRTQDNSNAGEFSFVPSSALLDHIVTTRDFDAELAGALTIIPRLDDQLGGYVGSVSDHLPVILRVPLQ